MIIIRVMTLIVLCTLTFESFAESTAEISYKIGKSVETLFYKKDFNAINDLDDDYRLNESRLPDGRWKTTFVYSSFAWVSKRGATNEWIHKLKIADEWIKATPSHPAPYLAKAELLINFAWDARGPGYADTVKPEQWELFHQSIADARSTLEMSTPLKSQHPFWFKTMVVIAKAQGWPKEEFLKLYNLSSELHPTYYFTHFRAADYFQPRWNGSKKELRDFVMNAVRKSHDKEGYTLYTRIYWSQLWALKDKTFAPGYAEWKYMKKGFEDIMNDYPNSTWNLNAFASYACLAEDWPTMQKLALKIGDSPETAIWNSQSKYYACLNEANSHL